MTRALYIRLLPEGGFIRSPSLLGLSSLCFLPIQGRITVMIFIRYMSQAFYLGLALYLAMKLKVMVNAL
jgi:hypothetical protein